jgi:hypothetical protein
VWSLLCNALEFGVLGRTDFFRSAVRALSAIVTGRNPLLGAPTSPEPRAAVNAG